MKKMAYTVDSFKLTSTIQLLDEARRSLLELEAEPIKLIPNIKADQFNPVLIIEEDELVLQFSNKIDDDDYKDHNLEELFNHFVSQAEIDELEIAIIKLSRLLATAATQRANLREVP